MFKSPSDLWTKVTPVGSATVYFYSSFNKEECLAYKCTSRTTDLVRCSLGNQNNRIDPIRKENQSSTNTCLSWKSMRCVRSSCARFDISWQCRKRDPRRPRERKTTWKQRQVRRRFLPKGNCFRSTVGKTTKRVDRSTRKLFARPSMRSKRSSRTPSLGFRYPGFLLSVCWRSIALSRIRSRRSNDREWNGFCKIEKKT